MKYIVNVNSKRYEVEIEKAPVMTGAAPAAQPVFQQPVVSAAQPVVQPQAAPAAQPTGNVEVRSPMPGNIWEVKSSVGQSVAAGDVLIVLEAMKMENDIVAPSAGVVNQILVSKGATVETGDVLVVLR